MTGRTRERSKEEVMLRINMHITLIHHIIIHKGNMRVDNMDSQGIKDGFMGIWDRSE